MKPLTSFTAAEKACVELSALGWQLQFVELDGRGFEWGWICPKMGIYEPQRGATNAGTREVALIYALEHAAMLCGFP